MALVEFDPKHAVMNELNRLQPQMHIRLTAVGSCCATYVTSFSRQVQKSRKVHKMEHKIELKKRHNDSIYNTGYNLYYDHIC